MPRFFVLRGRIARSAGARLRYRLGDGICRAGQSPAARRHSQRDANRAGPQRPASHSPRCGLGRHAREWTAKLWRRALGDPDFGQPEPLPAAGGQPNFAEQFGQPDLFGGPAGFHDGITGGPQVHPLFARPWFAHEDPNDPLRHIGLGQPLIGTSWRNRPLYFGTFVGGILMDDIQSHKIYQNDTAFIGLRIGYDFDHFWGMEMRGAFRTARPGGRQRRSAYQTGQPR